MQSGNARAGGLIGFIYGGVVSNCFAKGNVTANSIAPTGTSTFINSYAGGLASSNSGTIINCFATGNITAISEYNLFASASAGGLVASNSGTITNSYRLYNQSFYRKDVTGTYYDASNISGTICVVGQLYYEDFYINTLGWSTSIWDFSSVYGGHPKFVWEVLKS